MMSSSLSFSVTELSALFCAWVTGSSGACCNSSFRESSPGGPEHTPWHHKSLWMAMKMTSEVVSRSQTWVGSLQSPKKVQATKLLLKSNLRNWGFDGKSPNSVPRLWRATWMAGDNQKPSWKGHSRGQEKLRLTERCIRHTSPWSSPQPQSRRVKAYIKCGPQVCKEWVCCIANRN